MNKNVVFSADEAWMAVSLEERLELITRANAEGVLAAAVGTLLIGSVAYGLDKLWLFGVGAALSLLLIPLVANLTWRREKPELILRFLAARSMAKRYARAHKIENTEALFLFRGEMQEEGDSTPLSVWICLLRGGVTLLSEQPGGAKLEFLSGVAPDTTLRSEEVGSGNTALFLTGSGFDNGRTVIISSRYRAALYVFERLLAQLLTETSNKK